MSTISPESRVLVAPDEARRMRERARRRAERAETRDGALGKAERWIGEHPAVVIGTAFAIGLTLGWWVKR